VTFEMLFISVISFVHGIHLDFVKQDFQHCITTNWSKIKRV